VESLLISEKEKSMVK